MMSSVPLPEKKEDKKEEQTNSVQEFSTDLLRLYYGTHEIFIRLPF
jgi:hypothetical protein